MSYTVACFSIDCTKILEDSDPVYRVFYDGQLVSERRFWPSVPDYRIQEQLTLLDDNRHHTVEIKNVFPDRGDITVERVEFFDGDTLKPVDVYVQQDQKHRYTFKTQKR